MSSSAISLECFLTYHLYHSLDAFFTSGLQKKHLDKHCRAVKSMLSINVLLLNINSNESISYKSIEAGDLLNQMILALCFEYTMQPVNMQVSEGDITQAFVLLNSSFNKLSALRDQDEQ